MPALILVSHEIEECALLAEALTHQERTQGRDRACRSAARRRSWSITRSPMRARRSAASSPTPPRSASCSTALAECFGLARAPRRIEVYDNSHIMGTNAVGAMIVAGPEGFQKNQYRKFNIRSADLTPGDDFAHDARGAGAPLQAADHGIAARMDVPADVAGAVVAGARRDVWLTLSSHCTAVQAELAPRGPSPRLRGEGGCAAAAKRRRASRVRGTLRASRSSNAPHPDPLPVKNGEREPPRGTSVRTSTARMIAATRSSDSPWPDLVIIDGGRGQLTAAQANAHRARPRRRAAGRHRQGAGARCRPRDLLRARRASRSS